MQFSKPLPLLVTIFLVWVLHARLLNAQQSGNLTITFSRGSLDDCVTNGSSNGLSFSTSSVPLSGECFNLIDLFTQNFTTGFRNQTPSTVNPQSENGIQWVIYNPESFDSSANYSHIWYQQVSPGSNQGAGEEASRSLTVYNGKDCMQTGQPVQPWFGWTCQSEANGNCETLPFNLQSFRIDQPKNVGGGGGKCWSFAYQGAANRNSPNGGSLTNTMVKAILVLTVTTIAAI